MVILVTTTDGNDQSTKNVVCGWYVIQLLKLLMASVDSDC